MPMPMRIAFLAAECEPWAKTGGLADVVDALARALGQIGSGDLVLPVDVYLPRYRGIQIPDGAIARTVRVPDPRSAAGVTALQVIDVEANGYRLRLVDHPPAFDRESYYGDAKGDYPDNAWRFGLFCRAALEQLRAEDPPPDLIHLHDWHAAPALLFRDAEPGPKPGARAGRGSRSGPETTTAAADFTAPASGGARAAGSSSSTSGMAALLTIHNLAYHGWTPANRLGDLGLAPGDGTVRAGADGLDLLLSAIERAELVNTVSPGFAAEALHPEQGMGLDGALRARGDTFFGILNGLDTDLWNPATDRSLPATYSAENRSGKATCRTELLKELGMDPADRGPLLSMIGRLDRQKGFDLLAAAAPALVKRGIRLGILGSGSPELVGSLRKVAAANPDRVAIVERFDRDLARRLYAGADGFVMPSLFEPCGTGQMIALRYGTPPIVRATGGLRDTVIDVDERPQEGTGFKFRPADPTALLEACDRFLARFKPGDPDWEALLDRGMAVSFDWRSASAPAYIDAYRRAIAIRRGS
ncbi:MAG TPA: glycogen/starch synthase [Candidatus Eisenbacteria bacterium]|nr:glycogen/starch synthase [Candidatus Eisenbacteria bacterium]